MTAGRDRPTFTAEERGETSVPVRWLARTVMIIAIGVLVVAVVIVGNVVAGNMLSTGAFEVSLNGEMVWSKIDSGRFPQMHELVHALKAHGLQ